MRRFWQGFMAAGLMLAIATPSLANKQDSPTFDFSTPLDSERQEAAAKFKQAILSREMSEAAKAILSETSDEEVHKTGEGVCRLVSDGIDEQTYLDEFPPGESPQKEVHRHIWEQAVQSVCSPATNL